MDEVDSEYHGDILYTALCRKCESPFLIRQSRYGIPGEFETVTSEVVLFPTAARFPLEGVPDSVRRSYEQAVRCFQSTSYDACALMCRRCLEALCKTHEATAGTLFGKLDELQTMEVISPRLNAWAHGIRVLGNEAAHDVDYEILKDNARDAIDFVEAILLYVFVLNERFHAFKNRHDQRNRSR